MKPPKLHKYKAPKQWRNKAKCRPLARQNAAPSRALINSLFLPWPFFCRPLPNFCPPPPKIFFVCRPSLNRVFLYPFMPWPFFCFPLFLPPPAAFLPAVTKLFFLNPLCKRPIALIVYRALSCAARSLGVEVITRGAGYRNLRVMKLKQGVQTARYCRGRGYHKLQGCRLVPRGYYRLSHECR